VKTQDGRALRRYRHQCPRLSGANAGCHAGASMSAETASRNGEVDVYQAFIDLAERAGKRRPCLYSAVPRLQNLRNRIEQAPGFVQQTVLFEKSGSARLT